MPYTGLGPELGPSEEEEATGLQVRREGRRARRGKWEQSLPRLSLRGEVRKGRRRDEKRGNARPAVIPTDRCPLGKLGAVQTLEQLVAQINPRASRPLVGGRLCTRGGPGCLGEGFPSHSVRAKLRRAIGTRQVVRQGRGPKVQSERYGTVQ